MFIPLLLQKTFLPDEGCSGLLDAHDDDDDDVSNFTSPFLSTFSEPCISFLEKQNDC